MARLFYHLRPLSLFTTKAQSAQRFKVVKGSVSFFLEVKVGFSWLLAAPLFLSRGKVGIVQSGLGTAGWFVVADFLLQRPNIVKLSAAVVRLSVVEDFLVNQSRINALRLRSG